MSAKEPTQWKVTCVSVRGATAFQIEPAPASLEEVQAVRALITAAPDVKRERDELREALECIRDYINKPGDHCHDIACHALAKGKAG